MNLRELAEHDLSLTLEDSVHGFGWNIEVTDPDGNTKSMIGQSGDIGFEIDPNTGQIVSGRFAHVSLRISSFDGLSGLPRGVADNSGNPWKFKFNDVNENEYVYICQESMPDRTLGIVTCALEAYKEAS